MHKNHGLKSTFDVCPVISDISDERPKQWFQLFLIFGQSSTLGSAMLWLSNNADFLLCWSYLDCIWLRWWAIRSVDEFFWEQPLRPPLVIFLPLRSSRLHRLGYLSIAIHHDFHFIALLRSSTVDDIYVVSDSCLLLSFASLNYLKIFNF